MGRCQESFVSRGISKQLPRLPERRSLLVPNCHLVNQIAEKSSRWLVLDTGRNTLFACEHVCALRRRINLTQEGVS